MEFTFYLPDKSGKSIEYKTNSNALIIIGANGTGKSNLGSWIKDHNHNGKIYKVNRYSNEMTSSSESKKINEFYRVLNEILENKNILNDKYVADCKTAERKGQTLPEPPRTPVDELVDMWPHIFPNHKLIVEGTRFYAVLDSKKGRRYSVSNMGDGERAVLYLASQILSQEDSNIFIIDDPEMYMNRYLSNLFWETLENYRKESLFVYITHDTQFAATHSNCEKFWIKEYDGDYWSFERLTENELPEDLLLDILGSRNNILFVEGEQNSYDTQLYSILYPQYHVIPCGGCTTVISRTKAFKLNANLYDCEVFGLIDRDFRTKMEIKELRDYDVFVIDVAEVENLFLVEELIRFMAKHLGKNPDEVFGEIKDYVINNRFYNQLNDQIYKSIVSEIRYRLSLVEVSKKTGTDVDEIIDNIANVLNSKEIKDHTINKFRTVYKNQDYANVIKIYNEKNISKTIGKYFGLNNNAYCGTVINLLKGEKREELVNIFEKYLPEEIPR